MDTSPLTPAQIPRTRKRGVRTPDDRFATWLRRLRWPWSSAPCWCPPPCSPSATASGGPPGRAGESVDRYRPEPRRSRRTSSARSWIRCSVCVSLASARAVRSAARRSAQVGFRPARTGRGVLRKNLMVPSFPRPPSSGESTPCYPDPAVPCHPPLRLCPAVHLIPAAAVVEVLRSKPAIGQTLAGLRDGPLRGCGWRSQCHSSGAWVRGQCAAPRERSRRLRTGRGPRCRARR